MLKKRLFGPALLGTILAGNSAIAQKIPPTPPPGRFNPNPVVTRPGSIEDSGLYGYWNQMTEQDRAGGALLGKVVINDELLPWDPIVVTVSCNGSTMYTAETDPKGYFAILPSRISGELSQQGDRERQMKVHFEGCRLEGVLTGFTSSTLTVTEHNLRDSPEIGTIALTRKFAARGTAISATSKSAPASAGQDWTKAGEEMRAEKPDRARRHLEEAVRVYPGFAEAWYRLGVLQLISNPQDAQVCLRRAAAADPAFVPPHEQNRSTGGATTGLARRVAEHQPYLQLDPQGSAHIWYYSALSNFQLGNFAAAENGANKLLAMDPLHNIRNGEQLLAVILARRADYTAALAHLRHCLSYVPDGPHAELLRAQIAQLEKHVAKTN